MTCPAIIFLALVSLFVTPVDAFGQSGGESEPTFPLEDSSDIYAPGGTEQYVDSIYIDGKLVRLRVHIEDHIKNDSVRLRAMIDSIENAEDQVFARNITFNPEDWQPTDADRARRAEDLAIAQDREFIYNRSSTELPLFSIPTNSIGVMLGLEEDISPRIRYEIEVARKVTIEIYTQSALHFVTLVDEQQNAGSHSLTWDFNDQNGRRALAGSYFARVIADGEELVFQKRIVVP